MTFPTIFLIEVCTTQCHYRIMLRHSQHTGRRRLLQISTLGAVVSLFCVGIGLNTNSVTLSSAAILTFIMCVLPVASTDSSITPFLMLSLVIHFPGPSLSASARCHSSSSLRCHHSTWVFPPNPFLQLTYVPRQGCIRDIINNPRAQL
jgi:hypothetical protein